MFRLLLVALLSFAQSQPGIVGVWRTVDEKTGESSGTVRIYEDHRLFFGKIEASTNPKDASRVCLKCKDDRHGQPLIGLVLIRNLRAEGGEYAGGDLIDPNTGNLYRCKVKVSPDGKRLILRGYLGISLIGRTQEWTRE